MKICSAQILLALTCFGISMAHTNHAQILDKTVSVNLKEVSFEQALKQLELAGNIKFAYSISQLAKETNVTLQAEDKPLRAILEEILSPRKITYTVYEKESTIALKKHRADYEEGQSFIPDTMDDLPPVTGTVSDASTKLPMAGVNIIVKRTVRGTTTDADGKFTIDVDNGDVLVFSFIGYLPFEYVVADETKIDIVLQEDITSLKEVVVNAGYYTTTKETQTGSIAKVDAEAISRQPVANPLSALQGNVPGLMISQSSGVPGGNFVVRIRGQNSIGSGNDPLYIIDGVPFTSTSMSVASLSQNVYLTGTNPLNMLNPSNIESIEILKDADATAIYGSRGSNGVILITTKKGAAGKTKVDINFYSGASQVTRQMDVLNTPQYLEMRREALRNDNTAPNPTANPDLVLWDTTRYTDWQKELYGGTASTSDFQLSVSGGNENLKYNFGGGFHRETSVFPGENSDRRIAAHANISSVSKNDKFRTALAINYSVNDTDFINRDLTSIALSLPPVAPPLYDSLGEFNWGVDAWNLNIQHPLQHLKTSYESLTKNLLANAQLSYAILANVHAKVNFGYTDVISDAITLTPTSYYYPPTRPTSEHSSLFSDSNFDNWTVEPQLNWTFGIGSKSKFDILTGLTFLNQTTSSTLLQGTGFANESLMRTLRAATTITPGNATHSQYRYQSIFSRINYIYNEKYILNITGRRDGSSRFGSANRYANFGAIGAAWIFSKEQFIEDNLRFVSFGKLRVSYGVTGNDQLANNEFLDTYTSSRPYQGVPGLSPVRLSNPVFAWETNTKFESGLDFGFIENRIQGTVGYYRNKSSNQLVGIPLPPATGFNTIQSNSPAVVLNTGLEFEVNTHNIDREGFDWSTSFNLTLPNNELMDFPDLERSAYANTLAIGEPLTIRKLYFFNGVNPTTGVYEVRDYNGDGVFNVNDRQSVNFIGQNYFAGLQNTLQYRNWQLTFSFQYVNQQAPTYINYMQSPGSRFNQPVYVWDRWQYEGDLAETQRFSSTSAAASAHGTLLRLSDKVIGDASFVRLKNVYLSFSIPQQLLERMKLANVKLFIQGQNLLTFTEYKGVDPETQGSSLPPLKVLTGGIQLTF